MNNLKRKAFDLRTALIVVLCVLCLFSFTACNQSTTETEADFSSWNQDAESLKALVNYVDTVTDEESEDYIPVENRIAVFDMDGTIFEELAPTYIVYVMLLERIDQMGDDATDDMKRVAEELKEDLATGDYSETLEMEIENVEGPAAYAGMTLDEYYDFAYSILDEPVEGFSNMTYGESYFRPMAEVIDYLNENDFTVYLCSGSDRYACRAIIEYSGIDIDPSHIIGTDVRIESTNQNGEPCTYYQYTTGEGFVRTGEITAFTWNVGKPAQIIQEIGKQPVLAFGNSNGDKSMCFYTLEDNPYKSAVFMVLADDDVRDYCVVDGTDEKRADWEECGFNVISMKNDFKTIYGENVEKTE